MTLNLFRRVFTIPRLIDQQQALIRAQNMLIADYQEEVRRLHLDYIRELRGVVCSWLIHLEQPELDLRDDLVELDMHLGHRAAVLEEHVV